MTILAQSDTITYEGTFEGWAAYGIILAVGVVLCVLIGLLVLPALLVAGVARRQAERVRNKRVATVITQYDPPRGLSPAQVGLLYDMHCGQNEIMATLFALEQRGIVRLVDARNVEILDQAAYAGLAEYEKIAIRIARGETSAIDTQRTVPIMITNADTGARYQFDLPLPQQKSLQAFSRAVRRSITDKGIPMRSFAAGFVTRVLIVALVLGLLPMLIATTPTISNEIEYNGWSTQSFMTAFFITLFSGFYFLPLYLGLGAFMVWLWTKLAGRYWINTHEARALWPELEGYKLYLKQVDLDNIQFESTDHASSPVTKTLPYAMVFGLETRWQARLEGAKTSK